jgi:hypothetical protein
LTLADLLDQAAESAGELTFTCVPPGDGLRSALDRDGDSFLNGDEVAAGSDPADPGSNPGNVPTPAATAEITRTPEPTLTSAPTDLPTIEATPTSQIPQTATAAALRARAWLPVGYGGD